MRVNEHIAHVYRGNALTSICVRTYRLNTYRLTWLHRFAIVLILVVLFVAARSVVPAYMSAQRAAIIASAQRHGLAPEVLAAILYNEMLGKEQRFLDTLIPGDSVVSRTVRESLLGWHFLTLKQLQWGIKGVAALLGTNLTVGPTGIRVSVGREIRTEVAVVGGYYHPTGLMERPSLVLDLMIPDVSIEYLAANLERGLRRAPAGQADDWRVSARWHNTGLTAYRPDVPPSVWKKGTEYVARVQAFLPEVTAILDAGPTPPIFRVMHQSDTPSDTADRIAMPHRYVWPATIMGAQ